MLKKFLSVAVAACLVIPAGSAFAGEEPAPERTRVDIVGMDYHFMLADGDEFPRKLAKGAYKFTFRNDSEKRIHEVVMFKLLHGKKLYWLLRMPEKKAQRHVRFVGATFAMPGKEAKRPIRADLTKGRYAMLCFVQNRKRTKPHFLKGMKHRFNVVSPTEL
ncbi:MAG: hypothetical protein ACRDJT_01765 [Actinomycetota bacterium]